MLKQKETLVGRYEIVKHLCSGEFTETYLAEDKFLPDKPRCVIKQLRAYDKALKLKPDYTDAKEARQRIVAKL